MSHLVSAPVRLLGAVRAVPSWPRAAHHRACRNAMVALTECTRRRGEREDVERWLAARTASETASVTVISHRA